MPCLNLSTTSSWLCAYSVPLVASEVVQDLEVQPTNTTVTVSWDPPFDANGIISSYQAEITDASNQSVATMTTDASTTMLTFMDLMPFTNYTMSVVPFTGMDSIAGTSSGQLFMTGIGSKYCGLVSAIMRR